MAVPRKTRTVTEYRLLIQRKGNALKDWRCRSLKGVERRIGLLTHPEPWRFFASRYEALKGPDDYVCCAGTYHDECSCGGVTMREQSEAARRDLPPIESLRLEARQITTTGWVEHAMPLPEGVVAKGGLAQSTDQLGITTANEPEGERAGELND
jgi:hypothetical protein